jgi:hypothetical protein
MNIISIYYIYGEYKKVHNIFSLQFSKTHFCLQRILFCHHSSVIIFPQSGTGVVCVETATLAVAPHKSETGGGVQVICNTRVTEKWWRDNLVSKGRENEAATMNVSFCLFVASFFFYTMKHLPIPSESYRALCACETEREAISSQLQRRANLGDACKEGRILRTKRRCECIPF